MDRLFTLGKFKISGYMLALIGFWIVITALNVTAPASQSLAKYGITTAQGNMIRATVLVPSLFIWVACLYAVLRFYRYTSFLRGSAEGTGFQKIALGLQLLFWGLVLPNVINLITAYNPDIPEVLRATTILRNYVTLFFYFTASWNIYLGIKMLSRTVKLDEKLKHLGYRAMVVFMTALTTCYVWAIFHNDSRYISQNPLAAATYYLPDWLIVLTMLIPYLITWTIGCLALIYLRGFARSVEGTVYRKAFGSVMYGIMVIVLLSMGLQLLVQGATALGNASLKVILLLVYLIILILGFGYLLLAKGARELTAIEEV